MSEDKDAEIDRLKGELAVLLTGIRSVSNGLGQTITLGQFESPYLDALIRGHDTLESLLQKHTPPLNCGSAAAGESPSHSGGGVKCEPDCRMCSGEYCKIHLNKPCDCDCLDRHGIFQNQETGKSALREVPTAERGNLSVAVAKQPEGSTPSLPATDKTEWLRNQPNVKTCPECGAHHFSDSIDCEKCASEEKHEKGAGV